MNTHSDKYETIHFQAFLNEFEIQLEEMAVRYKDALWNYYLRRQAEPLQAIERELTGIMLNVELFDMLDYNFRRPQDEITMRRIQLLLSEIRKMRVDGNPEHNHCVQAIREKLNNWMITFAGKTVTVYQIHQYISRQPDRGKRRLAYQSMRPGLDDISDAWQMLIGMRNRLARDYGYADFTEYALSMIEADESALFDVSRLPGEGHTFAHAGNQGFDAFDLSFSIAQLSHELDQIEFPADKAQMVILESLERIGLDPARLPLQTFDAGPDFPALCIPVAIPSDIKMMICSGASFDVYAHQAREYGRACHYASIREDFYSLKTVNPVLLNVSAEIFYHILTRNETLAKISGDSPFSADWMRIRQLYDNAQCLLFGCLAEFEMMMYREPFERLDELWDQVCRRYFGFREPPLSDWKIQEWYISRPFRALEMAVSRTIAERIYKKLCEMPEKLWGSFLTENIFIHGNRVSWKSVLSDWTD